MKYLFFIVLLSSCMNRNQLRKVDLLDGHTRKQHEGISQKVMVASQGVHSTQAGLKMIELGGNAFDAATAISFAISVERPQSTGIGGGGFMLIDGPSFKRPKAVDFREMAPIKAHSKMFLDDLGKPVRRRSLDGILASGVPGTVKGVLEVHQRYGALKLAQVLRPAVNLAEKGFRVYPHLARALKRREKVLAMYPASKAIFFKNDRPLQEGELLIQKDLAKTLRAIQEKGADGFYKGRVGRAITQEFKKRSGLIGKKDLESYQVIWREPVHGLYKEYEIFSMSPPSSGGTHIIQILNTLETWNLSVSGTQSAQTIHRTASAMQLAFVDRARYMGDTDFVKVPVKGLTSKRYAAKLRQKIKDEALKVEEQDLENAFNYESDETTHFTVMDANGNVVSSTQTVNYLMGSGVVIPGTGIVMNDEMDDFAQQKGDSNVFAAVGGQNNLVEPRKRPLSSMSPTIVKKNGRTILALGTPSGTRILTCVAQVMLNYLEHELNLWDAVAATRYHHQWRPDEIRVGDPGFSQTTEDNLRSRGHTINRKNLGCKVQAIARKNNLLHGVSDPRGEGMAQGY